MNSAEEFPSTKAKLKNIMRLHGKTVTNRKLFFLIFLFLYEIIKIHWNHIFSTLISVISKSFLKLWYNGWKVNYCYTKKNIKCFNRKNWKIINWCSFEIRL
jgi:hypothetical protein